MIHLPFFSDLNSTKEAYPATMSAEREKSVSKEPVLSRIRLWQKPLQRQDSNKNDFIDKEFISRLKTLPNTLPEGLEWLDFSLEMCDAIAVFYHKNFMLGTGPPPVQFINYIHYRMTANPPHLILLIADTQCSRGFDVKTSDGRDAKIIGIMASESFDVINQGKVVPVITIGGLAIDENWRGIGLVLNFMKKGASRVSGEHMHLFNLKKDRRLFPCAELSVWWYPLKPRTSLMMTIFKMNPGPPSAFISALCNRVNEQYAYLPCRVMRHEDVDIVCDMLRKESEKYSLARYWTSEHVARWLLPRKDVQFSYLVTDETCSVIKDFFSFHVISYSCPRSEQKSIRSEMAGLCESQQKHTTESDTIDIRVAVPGYLSTHNTRKEDMIRFMMHTAKMTNVDYIHGYGAFGYDTPFKNLGFIKNENEVHYLQMFNWDTRSFTGDEIGLGWIQF